jgi:hypothetical protein
LKSAGRKTNNTKTDIVVAVTRVIIVASGGAAIPRIVVPGAAALGCLPQFEYRGERGKGEGKFRFGVAIILGLGCLPPLASEP